MNQQPSIRQSRSTLERQERVRQQMQQQRLDALLVTEIPNIRYLTGFTGSTAMLFLSLTEAVLITDSRYLTQASRQVAGPVVLVEESYVKTVAQVIQRAHVRRVGFESAAVTYQQLNHLLSQVESNTHWVPTSQIVESLRIVKEPEEVQRLRRAIELTAEVFQSLVDQIKPGVRECELAAELEYRLRQRGAEKMSFDTIVASGDRSAMPHGVASDKQIGEGFVVFDFGIVLDGYCSDMTRTVYVGTPDARAQHVYQTVLQAQLHCEENMRAGMECKAIDALARDVITAAGFGDQFGHSTGHGIGLEVHEAPRLAKTADGRVPAGAVVTVEPGIYLPQWGGVRIEDMVLVTETGCQILTPASKELIVL